MNEPKKERLPAFVTRDGKGYHLNRRQAWTAAIVGPFIIWAVGFLIVCAIVRAPIGSSWYAHSLGSFGMLAMMGLGMSIAGAMKQERAIRQGIPRLPWHRLSIGEMLVILTAFAISLAIQIGHQRWMFGERSIL